jgi:hypothetical protein
MNLCCNYNETEDRSRYLSSKEKRLINNKSYSFRITGFLDFVHRQLDVSETFYL